MEEDLEARLMEILFDRVVRTSDMGALFEIRFSANNPKSVTPGEKFTLELEYSLNPIVVKYLKETPESPLVKKISSYLKSGSLEIDIFATKEAFQRDSKRDGAIERYPNWVEGNIGRYYGFVEGIGNIQSIGKMRGFYRDDVTKLLNGETLSVRETKTLEKDQLDARITGDGTFFLNAAILTGELSKYQSHFIEPIARHQVRYVTK